MPYINSKKRGVNISLNKKMDFDHPGDLNYVIHTLLFKYLDKNGLNYRSINDILGALEGVKQEFYRRLAVPYEEEKIKENGDITFYEKYEQ